MAKSARVHAAEEAARRRYRVETLEDADQIRTYLEARRLFAAYALGQLSPDLVGLVDCWRATDDDSGSGALVLYSRGGLGDAMFCMGEPEALGAILSLHAGPRQNYATYEPRHLDAMRRWFTLSSERPMLRMAVTARTFQPVETENQHIFVRRITGADAPQLNRLYNTEGSPTYYSGKQIDLGCYFGVVTDDRLVAVAGTHVVSHEEGIAVVGNVFTHPRSRGRGYATVATAATTAHLLAVCRDVVLTVDPDNTPAVRAYQRLGYETDCRLIEAAVTRTEVFSAAAVWRRMASRWRGRKAGVEVVLH